LLFGRRKEQVVEETITYYAVECPLCDDLFREFFIFCVQNTIQYEVKRYVKNIEEPVIMFGDMWFRGELAVSKFKEAWQKESAEDVV